MFLKYNNELIINSVAEEAVVILEPESLNLFELNSCGMAILILFNNKNSYDDVFEIIKNMCDKHEIDFNEQVYKKFVKTLLKYGFLEETTDSSTNHFIINNEIQKKWIFRKFNPEIIMISDMSEGFFSKVHVE